MKSEYVLELKNVDKSYPMDGHELKVLDNINIGIKRGERVAIIGPSGSGKSTLLHMIGCLDKPTRGAIKIDGLDVSKMSDDDLAKIRGKKIGFIFQSFFLLPSLNATDNVKLPMLFIGSIPSHDQEKRAKELLKMVGLGDRLHHMPSQLSGGQRQRVAIARSLANEPEIILADEPTGNLDSKSGKEIIDILVNLNEKKGATIIIITHDPAIANHAERIIHIKDGKVVGDTRNKKKIAQTKT